MKPLRNYFGQSELNHTFSKALKRKASDEFSEIISKNIFRCEENRYKI